MAFPAKKKGPPAIDLAVIMGGGPKGKGSAPMSEEDEGEEMPESVDMGAPEEESDGAFDVAFEEYSDESLSPEERKAAFRRAVMACMGGDY